MKVFKVGDKVRLLPISELELLEGDARVPSSQLRAFRSWCHRNEMFTVVGAESASIAGILRYQRIVLVAPSGERWATCADHLFTSDYFQLAETRYPTNHRSKPYAH